jgi:2-dehydropantoate 2-reductase
MNEATTLSSDRQSLKIAVVGMGGIGSTFAFQLAKTGGHEIVAVARSGSERLRQLQLEGGVVNIKGERAVLHIIDKLDETIAYDLVLVTLPAHQAEAVLPALQRSAARWIQFMFNTFNPERLRELVGAHRCSFGMPFVQGYIDKEGKLTAQIGAGGQRSKMNNEIWVKLFNQAGLPATFEQNMILWLRCHVPLCIAFESVCVAGMQRGGGASWDEALTIARGMKESFILIERLGYRLYPSGKRRLRRSPAFAGAGMLWSMSRIRSFRELLATGVNECRALLDVLLALAPKARPAVATAKIEAMRPRPT